MPASNAPGLLGSPNTSRRIPPFSGLLTDNARIAIPSLLSEVKYGDGVWLATERNPSTSTDDIAVWRSVNDGATWQRIILKPGTKGGGSLAYGNGIWIVQPAGYFATPGVYLSYKSVRPLVSRDKGLTWTELTTLTPVTGWSFAYGRKIGWVAVTTGWDGTTDYSTYGQYGNPSNSKSARSTDNGLTWTYGNVPLGVGQLARIVYMEESQLTGAGRFYAINYITNTQYTSVDAVNWSNYLMSPSNRFTPPRNAITFQVAPIVLPSNTSITNYSSTGALQNSLLTARTDAWLVAHTESNTYGQVQNNYYSLVGWGLQDLGEKVISATGYSVSDPNVLNGTAFAPGGVTGTGKNTIKANTLAVGNGVVVAALWDNWYDWINVIAYTRNCVNWVYCVLPNPFRSFSHIASDGVEKFMVCWVEDADGTQIHPLNPVNTFTAILK